jgi:hypothetical protein
MFFMVDKGSTEITNNYEEHEAREGEGRRAKRINEIFVLVHVFMIKDFSRGDANQPIFL